METPLTPLELVRRSRSLYADREAVVDGELRLTYAEFLERCDRWSFALQQMGVRQGDRVAYVAPNTHANLESFYAVPQIGAVLVPVNYRLSADDFAFILDHSGARVVCAHADYLDAIDSIRDRLPGIEQFVALEGARPGWLDYEAIVASSAPSFDQPEIGENDLLTINYTSGTTARPKGVMITHRNAFLNLVGALVLNHMTPADRYLWTLPMFHANGWTFVWGVTAVGGTHVCLRRVAPEQIFEQVRRERITMFCAAPTVLIGVANTPATARGDLPRGVRLLTGGAPPAAATIRRLEGDLGWEIIHVYGLTETSPFLTMCEPRPEHVGLAEDERATIKSRQGVELLTSGELRVVDERGAPVPRDGQTMGEIIVRGNAVMKGYYRDLEATAAAIRDGWFHTGDAAVVHHDGYLEIRDRLKDVIISGGENISSLELEAALMRHPAILEVAVVGLPDEQWGESPHAFVVFKSGAHADEAELRQFARDNLAHFKAPRHFHPVDELPKNATGKVQKYALRGGRAAIARQ
jgi:fatty-acyl-CoA synthase